MCRWPPCVNFIAAALPVVDATIRANRREDGMYHSYNLLQIHGNKATVRFLNPMLEGQVAVLSSGMLSPDEVLQLLKSLRDSDLYRRDQHSYMLYPDREVTPFLARNTLPDGWKEKAPLLASLIAADDRKIVVADEEDHAHFQSRPHKPEGPEGRIWTSSRPIPEMERRREARPRGGAGNLGNGLPSQRIYRPQRQHVRF